MRLIDLNHLLELVKKNAPFIYSILAPIAMLCPTIEAEPVRHGRWEEVWDYNYMQYFHQCSECGRDALTKEETMHDEVLSFYCPNCGAKMDEEVES